MFKPPSILNVWRRNGTALDPQNVLKIVKHGGGGNVMVWEYMACLCISNLHLTDNIMTAWLCLLQDKLIESANKLGLVVIYLSAQQRSSANYKNDQKVASI